MLHQIGPRRSTAAGERGDTLIEVLIALAVVAVAATALIGGVLTSITASSAHRSLAVNDADLKSYAEAAQNQIQRQASPLFADCATSYTVTPPSMPAGYTVAITGIEYWSGSAFTSTCQAGQNAPQLITLTATSPTQVHTAMSFAVRNPS